VEVKEQYQVRISNRFETSENLDYDDDVDINRACEIIMYNMKVSATQGLDYYELKEHRPWFDEESSKLLHQRSRLNCNGYRTQVNKLEII
jgi:hypothetical protein